MQIVETEKMRLLQSPKEPQRALDNVVVNDEEENRLRGAFEEHMQNYQKSMDQFQEFFNNITVDLESTFKEREAEVAKADFKVQ